MWALRAGVYWCTIHKNIHLAQPRHIAVHVFGRTPMLFTKPPAQEGAVHIIAHPEEKNAIFDPSKWTGGLTGTKKTFPHTFLCDGISLIRVEGVGKTHRFEWR